MDEQVKMTYSCLLQKTVRVCFETERDGIACSAEGTLPDGRIDKNQGFSEEEVGQLELYLRQNRTEIMQKAKEISGITHFFGGFTK